MMGKAELQSFPESRRPVEAGKDAVGVPPRSSAFEGRHRLVGGDGKAVI